MATPADADGHTTARRGLGEAERQRAELDRRLGAAEERLDEARATLTALEEELAVASAERVAAERQADATAAAAEAARQRAERAAEELLRTERALASEEQRLDALARESYMYGRPTISPAAAVLDVASTDVGVLSDALHYLQRGVRIRAAAVERTAALAVQVEVLIRQAEEEQRERDRAAEEAAEAAEEAGAADARLRALLADASVEHEARQQAVATLERDRDRADVRASELRRQAEESERRNVPSAAAATRDRDAGTESVTTVPGPGGLVTVGGITVAAELGPSLAALLEAARADGFVLGGTGWRSTEVQIRLRRANGCPDIYESPASACRVPTARPGSSEHETGLAVDFTWQGRTICYPLPAARCSGNAAFDWLQQNAGRFGLKNLPSEAWHWSTTGR